MQQQFKREEIHAALDRVLADARFSRTATMRNLLRFTVERSLAGRAEELKEVVLGVEALERGIDFDPKSDPVVRVQMSRIRARLAEYYAAEGSGEAVRIQFAKGSYAPEFVRADASVSTESDGEDDSDSATPAPARSSAARVPQASRWRSWALALAGLGAVGLGWLFASRNANYAATAKEKAEESYRLGNYLRFKQKSELYPQAEVAYQKAVELDPSHMKAQVGLAIVRMATAADRRKAIRDARAVADRVIQADPANAEAYDLRCRIRCFWEYDWDGALEDARQSLRWAPGSDSSHRGLGGTLQTVGKLDEALQPMRRATELAPNNETHWHDLADHYWRMGRTDAALREVNRLVSVNADFPMAHRLLGRIHLSLGKLAEALAQFDLAPQPMDLFRAAALKLIGRTAEANAIVATFEADPEKMFRYWAITGDADRAIPFLEKATAEKLSSVPGFYTSPEADRIRKDPRFQRIYKSIGLPR